MSAAERCLHYVSVGANFAAIVLCVAAGAWLLVGWAIVNGAVSTTALWKGR